MTELTKEDFLLLSEAAKDYPPGFAVEWGSDHEVNQSAETTADLVQHYLDNPEHG
jgi:hypothetical protein